MVGTTSSDGYSSLKIIVSLSGFRIFWMWSLTQSQETFAVHDQTLRVGIVHRRKNIFGCTDINRRGKSRSDLETIKSNSGHAFSLCRVLCAKCGLQHLVCYPCRRQARSRFFTVVYVLIIVKVTRRKQTVRCGFALLWVLASSRDCKAKLKIICL